MRWPWHRRKVTCATCGYFCRMETRRVWLGQSEHFGGSKSDQYEERVVFHEVDPVARQTGTISRSAWWSLREVRCFKHAAQYALEVADILPPEQREVPNDLEPSEEARRLREVDRQLHEAIARTINTPRHCDFWFCYRRGYGPELHRDLEERHRLEWSARVWNVAAALAGAAIGGGLTILAAWLLAG